MTTSLFGLGSVVQVNVNGTLVPQSFLGTLGQTIFNITAFIYVPGTNSLLVFINGQRQISGRDFVETSGTSFTLNEGVVDGDFVDIIGFPQTTLSATTAGATTFTPPGAGGIIRSVQSKLEEYVSVLDYGGLANVSTPAQRTLNSAAILKAAAVSKKVIIPVIGTYWIDPNVEIPINLQLSGLGKEVTFIKGDGDLFKWTQTVIGSPLFRDFFIANDITNGKLFRTQAGGDLPPAYFERVSFGKSNYHLFSLDTIVGWHWTNCHFNAAAIVSRQLFGAWACVDMMGYTWFNGKGIVVSGGTSVSCSSIGSVFEYNTSHGVHLQANGGDILGWLFDGCHFEGNGSGAGASDVHLETITGNQIRSVQFRGCGWFVANSVTVRIQITSGGGGNQAGHKVEGGYVSGAIPICTNVGSITIDPDVTFQATVAPTLTLQPVTIAKQYSAGFMGSQFVAGPAGVSGTVQALITIPTGCRRIKIQVDGNSYNGAPNANTGQLLALFTAVNGNVRTQEDVNHSAGANQGWVVATAGGGTQIQVANKAAMTNPQSGDCNFEFWST